MAVRHGGTMKDLMEAMVATGAIQPWMKDRIMQQNELDILAAEERGRMEICDIIEDAKRGLTLATAKPKGMVI